MRPVFLLIILIVVFGCTAEDETASLHLPIVETINTDAYNAALVPGRLTADVGIYVPQTDDIRYNSRVPLDTLLARFAYAQTIFDSVGVQLKLLWVKHYTVPDTSWLTIPSNIMQSTPQVATYATLYHKMRDQQSTLAPKAEQVFNAIIEPDNYNDRTLYLVGLRDVYMSYFEQDSTDTWGLHTDPVNALSFPSYILEDRIPRRLRGVISMQNAFISRKVVAHEIGHKLLNVSHQYGTLAPHHEIDAEGGLMVYGEGIDIPSGADGRWHQERLMLSPFLYREQPDGTRAYNPDYAEHGHYYDPIYGDYVVR